MLTIELKLKLEGREVPIDKFLEIIATQIGEGIRNEVRQMISLQPKSQPTLLKQDAALSKRRALGVREAANTLALSEASVRNFIREGRLFAVKVGRRVLIPLESLEKTLTEGIRPKTSKHK
jgi:excisionase family DNA binding protein